MKNHVDISTDGVNVYVNSCVRSSTAGKVVLTVMNIFVLSFFIFLLSSIEREETGKMIIPILLIFIVFIFFPWKYWFWNFFGKENVVISTKTILIQLDYGIIRTKPKLLSHNKLSMNYESVREFDGEEYGRIKFITYNDQTNLAEFIGESTVLIPKKKIEDIMIKVGDLYKVNLEGNVFFSSN